MSKRFVVHEKDDPNSKILGSSQEWAGVMRICLDNGGDSTVFIVNSLNPEGMSIRVGKWSDLQK